MRKKPHIRTPAHVIRRHPTISRWGAAAIAVSILILATTGCNAPTETRDDGFTVGEHVRLVVTSMNGNIDIERGDDGEVRVQATLKYPSKVEYELSQDGDTIAVSAQRTGKYVLFGDSPGADIAITTPANTDLELQTSNGRIEVSGVEGSCSLKTSNGRLNLTDIWGTVDARTSNGRIKVDMIQGTARLRTSNGSMEILRVKGSVNAETSNGRVSFSGELTAGGDNRLVTSNGDIDIELQGTPSVSLDASTSNGKVKSEQPILATVTTKDHIVGSYGDGEADLYVRTSNGDITIR